jgi:hypothetical protein
MLRPAQSMASSGGPYPNCPNTANFPDPLLFSPSANIVSLARPAGLGIPIVTAELWTRGIQRPLSERVLDLER